jgi:hypothetical protein
LTLALLGTLLRTAELLLVAGGNLLAAEVFRLLDPLNGLQIRAN